MVEEGKKLLRRFQVDGTLTYVNDAVCSFYQKERKQLLGHNLASFLSDDEREEIVSAIFSITPEQPRVITRPRFVTTDGRTRCVEYETKGVYAQNGKLVEYHSVGIELKKIGDLATTVLPSEFCSLKSKSSTNSFLKRNNIGVFSDAMKAVVAEAEKYHTDRSLPVLIEGETGVGKEVIAQIVHYGTEKSLLPFVDINCTAISPNLFESELFGYESGAFTGAVQKGKQGKLDCARGGTLFLDEVADIGIDLQGKLLRVLEEKHFYRVGGLKKISTDIRVVAATNVGFKEKLQLGEFRKDLYYRLKVGHIRIPSLRERPEDIVPLANMFLRAAARRRGKAFMELADATAELFERHSWPGNIRELKNLIDWASFMYDTRRLLPEQVVHRLDDMGLSDKGVLVGGAKSVQDITREDILAVVGRCGGNKTKAAQSLGISLRTLYNRLKR